LENRGDLRHCGERRALYSDIDYNGHVNNVRYIQWIQDSVDPAVLEQARQARLDINYLGEVKPGETVELWKAEFSAESWDWAAAFEGRRRQGDNAEPAFRAELRIVSG
jgi:acyl-ACP thioesterase